MSRRGQRPGSVSAKGATAVALSVGIIACVALRFHGQWGWLPAYLVAVQLPAFLLYAYDKLAAKRGRSRISERTLHLCALAGGSPAAYGAQLAFRHKTRKKSFRRVFWLLVVIQAALLVWSLWR